MWSCGTSLFFSEKSTLNNIYAFRYIVLIICKSGVLCGFVLYILNNQEKPHIRELVSGGKNLFGQKFKSF